MDNVKQNPTRNLRYLSKFSEVAGQKANLPLNQTEKE